MVSASFNQSSHDSCKPDMLRMLREACGHIMMLFLRKGVKYICAPILPKKSSHPHACGCGYELLVLHVNNDCLGICAKHTEDRPLFLSIPSLGKSWLARDQHLDHHRHQSLLTAQAIIFCDLRNRLSMTRPMLENVSNAAG